MMAKSTLSALTISAVMSVAGAANGWAQDTAPLAPRPFTPVGETAPAYEDSYQSVPYSTSSSSESASPSRFQLDGTESGSVSSKDVQTYNANSTRSQTQSDAPRSDTQRPFRATAPVRSGPHTGYSFGVYGGVNAAQEVDGSVTVPAFPGTVTLDLGTNDGVGAVAGLKIRYTWPFDEEPIDQWRDEVGGEGLRISGALEFEPGYVGGEINGTAGAANVQFDYHAFIFMANAYLVFQAGDFRPYAGVGGGGVYFMADGSNGVGSSESMGLAYQGILGLDYFLSPDWSIFAEYKYLVFDSLDLYTATNFDNIEQHIFLMGLRKNF